MSRRGWPWVVVAVVLALSACAALQHRSTRLAAALKFSHRRHATEGLQCDACHQGVERSAGLATKRHIPTKQTCKECHEDQLASECVYCHLGGSQQRAVKLGRPGRRLRFSHLSHQARDKAGCKGCHPRAAAAQAPGARLVPDHRGCARRCHQRALQDQRCGKCHQDLLRYPLRPVTRVGHRGNFIKRHGALARSPGRCLACHDQTHCGGCHGRTAAMPLSVRFSERVTARFVHRGDFLGRHARQAKAEPATCLKCHGARHCSSCHELQGLARPAAGATERVSSRSPHGPQWMTPGTADFHGRKARRQIASCAACHDRGAGSNCVTCHKVGALGGNPHPRGFVWSDKARACRGDAMCLNCHTGGAGCPP